MRKAIFDMSDKIHFTAGYSDVIDNDMLVTL